MAEVERGTRKRKVPWGRWTRGRDAAEALESPRDRPLPTTSVFEPILPEVAEVDAQALMGLQAELPPEPRMVRWTGEHLFVVLVAYQVDPLEMAQAQGRPQLKPNMALDTSPPTCYHCGQGWGLRTARSHCRGDRQI